MKRHNSSKKLFAIFRQLRWRLTLYFSLVTLAALLMVLWWSFLGFSLYLTRANPQASLEVLAAEFFQNLIPAVLPWLALVLLLAVLVSAVFGFITARWLENRLNILRQATDAWSDGDFSVRVRDSTQDEITRFGQQLNRMADEMEILLQSRQQLAALEERNQIARDLHDSVKQQLTAAGLQIGAARSLIESDPPAARQAILRAQALTQQAQIELTNIILELRPAALHEKGLAGALQSYLSQWSQQTGIRAEFHAQNLDSLPYNSELALFRTAQEALANVTRHSQASRVELRLCGGAAVELCIQDDGRGFDPATINSQGFGLKSMSDRMAGLNGSLEIASKPGGGARITARLPVPPSPENGGAA